MTNDGAPPDRKVISMPLHEERLTIRRQQRRTLVRATCSTVERLVVVDEKVRAEQIVVKRVAIGRVVDTTPPIREESGVTIIPVVEEELVLVRRLILKEEIHLERIRSTKLHVETVSLRREEVTVTRHEVTDR